jgi:carboxylesterase
VAVLLLHGLTGSPAEVRPIGEAISKTFGWKVEAPLLPGHGTTIEDLSRRTLEEWTDAVRFSRDRLLREHPRVHLLGLSMGAALAIESFLENRGDVASLVLLAPPLRLRSRWEEFLARTLPGIWIPERFRIQPKRRPKTPDWVGYDSYAIAAVGQFMRLCDRIRKMPTIPEVPALTIYSESDETIHPDSARFIVKRLTHPGSKVVRLEDAEHVLTLSREKGRVMEEVLAFYRGLGPNPGSDG